MLINPYVFGDSDAAAYIAAVEAADGQSLEPGVKNAISAFVAGCKSDNIWTAIKTSCVLVGARTLSGALVALKGTAPTNVNSGFVSGDYDRKTGLKGSRSSIKYLNSNRASNADPQNSQHFSVYVTQQGTTSVNAFPLTARSGSDYNDIVWANNTLISRSRGITANTRSSIAGLSGGFFGVARSTSTEFTSRSYGSSAATTATSVSPSSASYLVLGQGNLTTASDSRIAFYSIGEALDLALLDARVTTLINAIAAAIP